jgi:uncharacterized protein (DUF488 family)
MRPVVHTIGHSSHPIHRFVELLRRHAVTAIADVRSTPFSRLHPQFNRPELKADLRRAGIAYVFLGEELGARSSDPTCYSYGRVDYDKLARTDLFRRGIERVRAGAADHAITLMCAEKDPLDCHRTILVARHLEVEGLDVRHILADGEVETHSEAMTRLMVTFGLGHDDLFMPRDRMLADAYRRQGSAIAYAGPGPAASAAF